MESNKGKEVSCLFYGERGIVNAILIDIGKDKNKLATDLLNNIKYCTGNSMEFNDEDITSVKYLLEGSFGEWGNPDLMIKVESKSSGIVFYILEAKVKDFSKECAKKINGKYCFTGKSGGRNCASLINIQLALRARFMKEWKGYTQNNGAVEITSSYDEADGEKYKNGRALKDKYALKILKDFFFEDVIYEDNSVLPENVYYVSLSTKYDVKNVEKAFEGLLSEYNGEFVNHIGFLNYDAFIIGDYPHFNQAYEYIMSKEKN